MTSAVPTTSTTTAGNNIDLASNEFAYVAAGIVVGSQAIAITGLGANTVTLDGTASGQIGVWLANSSNFVSISDTGKAWGGQEGVEFFSNAAQSDLFNDGTVFGGWAGVNINQSMVAVHNTGLIQAGTQRDSSLTYNAAIWLDSSPLAVIDNSGTIQALMLGSFAIQSIGVGYDFITNSGKMIGNVALGDGGDRLDTRLGSLKGEIDMGGGNDTVYGSAAADTIYCGDGADIARGGGGKDFLVGGIGVDTADYSDKTLKVDVTLNGFTTVSVKINGIVEDAIGGFERVYGGSAGDRLVGDGLANYLVGNAGLDSISGGGGNDILNGGTQHDVMTGGANADRFRFTTTLGSSNIDTITDFVHVDDTIELDNAIMVALGGTFTSNEFIAKTSGHVATGANQHLIYDKSNGTLWYDKDGTGANVAVQLAQLGTAASHPTNLDYTDFAVI